MKLVFYPQAWSDYQYWQDNDKAILRKLIRLIEDTKRNPFSGIGKPEPLRHEFEGCWSKRITDTHRMIYRAEDEYLFVLQCRFHYDA